ncbi:hypothetical protein R1sor_012446 [Riccia sorocarpa]|uniref:HMA domain-containing protein n=1 Tax=Riccia sorocarpa TaxID=122646 RepID=A0ABD3I3T1_9MARC
MMSANELFYGDREPVFVVDTAAYPVRRGRSYTDPYAEKFYGGVREEYGGYRGTTRDRYSDYRSDYRSDYGTAYIDTPVAPVAPVTPYGYEATYYDSRPNEYYEYRKPSTVVLKVPICCETCAEEVRNTLFELRGVRSVYCDVRKEMVTVTGTAAPADVLLAVRKLHKKSRFWEDYDY